MWSLVHPSLTQCTCMEYDLQPLLSQSSPPPLLLKYTLFSRNTQVNVYIFCYIHAILLCFKRYWAYELGVHQPTLRQKDRVLSRDVHNIYNYLHVVFFKRHGIRTDFISQPNNQPKCKRPFADLDWIFVPIYH